MSRVLPILFNTEMVQAILDGKKTVTRRVVKKSQCVLLNKVAPCDLQREDMYAPWDGMTDAEVIKSLYTPPYQPGDIMYVRETWTYHEGAVGGIIFKARCPKKLAERKKWHPSIHMPKEAARIWLKATDVRVERLQDITPQEAWKEGARCSCMSPVPDCAGNKTEFIKIWNSTLKKSDLDCYGWDASPWVWVIEFERCEKPEKLPYSDAKGIAMASYIEGWNDCIEKLTGGKA